jgi:hypothetical protein
VPGRPGGLKPQAIPRTHEVGCVPATVRPRRRATPGSRARAALPRGGGTIDRADRRPPRPLAGDIKAYFYDPTGEKARAVKARYVGVCRGCGAYTQPRNGKGDAYAYCKRCHPGAIERKWTRELVIAAMLEWREQYGWLPSSYDWSHTHARRRGGEALRRLARGEWPAASVVSRLFGMWAAARATASGEVVDAPRVGGQEPVEVIGHTGDLCAQSAVIAHKIRQCEEVGGLA